MSNSDTGSRVIFLRPKPHPYDYHNIGTALSTYMREPKFLRILVNIFESAPHLYQDFIPDEDMFKDEAPPQTWSDEKLSRYIADDIDSIQWRTDVRAVPNANLYRRNRAEVNIVSCVVADLSGGSVKITLTCYKPETMPMVEVLEARIYETWLSGEDVDDFNGKPVNPSTNVFAQAGNGGVSNRTEKGVPSDSLNAESEAESVVVGDRGDTSHLSTSHLLHSRRKEKPWERFPAGSWRRNAVERWWHGEEVNDIAKDLGYSHKTIRNFFASYRKNKPDGTRVIPTMKELQEMGLRRF